MRKNSLQKSPQKLSLMILAFLIVSSLLGGCASKKKKPDLASKPKYHSAEALFHAKSALCQNDVDHFIGNQPMNLTPEAEMLNEETSMFCVQKLKRGAKVLKITAVMEEAPKESGAVTPTPSATSKFFTTGFDLVKYDKTLTQLQSLKPVVRKHEGMNLFTYYDFKKLKSLPAYFVVLYQREDSEHSFYSGEIMPSQEAVSDHGAVTGAAGFAMGGFAAGTTVSTSQPLKPMKFAVYTKKPTSLKIEWVSGVGK